MASTDARPIPEKNVAYRVTFPIYDADGDLVTGATGLDSEVSKDAGTFADCTNEATEIATASGMYYLDLTSGEMNADTVAIIVKTSTVGAKTTVIVMYPEEAGDIRTNVTQVAGTTQTAGDIYNRLLGHDTRFDANGIDAGGSLSNRLPAILVSGRMDSSVGAIANNAITASSINTDAITAAKLAADVAAEIQAGLSTLTQANVRTAVGLASANLDVQFAAIAAFIDTEVAAIKVVTDKLGTTLEVDGGNWRFTVSSLVNAPAGGGGGGGATAAQVWDLADGIEVGLTPRQAMRLISAVLAGDAVVVGNNIKFRNAVADTKARIDVNTDVEGNRTFNSIDPT